MRVLIGRTQRSRIFEVLGTAALLVLTTMLPVSAEIELPLKTRYATYSISPDPADPELYLKCIYRDGKLFYCPATKGDRGEGEAIEVYEPVQTATTR